MPYFPANVDILESTATNTATGYFADDATNPTFFIEGAVRSSAGEAVLTFIVLAEKGASDGTAIRGAVRGREFFEAMWSHFSACGTVIDVIQAEWTSAPLSAAVAFATNLDAFNAAVQFHPTLDAAALDGTVTGKYAKGKGHTTVVIVRALPPSAAGQKGPFEDVVVQFRRT